MNPILSQAVTKLEKDQKATSFCSIPWGHHVLLLNKIKEKAIRFWYMEQILKNGWSLNILTIMIQNDVHLRKGKSTTNFKRLLLSPESELGESIAADAIKSTVKKSKKEVVKTKRKVTKKIAKKKSEEKVMAIAKHHEDLVSHIPAVHLLVNLGYHYLAPSETLKLREGKRSKVVLESVLEKWFSENNSIQTNSGAVSFSRENIKEAVSSISNISFDSLLSNNE